jgi:predicted metal-dependent HD superfamily phosphohydrolase
VNRSESRWSALWGRLGARGDGRAVHADLRARYAAPERAYHTLAHIAHGLQELDTARHLCRDPDVVELAFWFHDAVYDPRAHDNEERSAALARDVAGGAGLAEDRVRRVSGLILLTKHAGTPPADADGEVLLDADLAILGAPPPEFDRYEQQVRREYAWVPEATFTLERARILRSFLARPRLYFTDHFRRRHEPQARMNLERSLKRLESRFSG